MLVTKPTSRRGPTWIYLANLFQMCLKKRYQKKIRGTAGCPTDLEIKSVPRRVEIVVFLVVFSLPPSDSGMIVVS